MHNFSGVIIKGLEMPSACWICPMCNETNCSNGEKEFYCTAFDHAPTINVRDVFKKRADFCPLAEIKIIG